MAEGLLIAFTRGDQDYASALYDAWLDSNEDMEWYLAHWTRDELIHWGF